jgi:hypothetical protein
MGSGLGDGYAGSNLKSLPLNCFRARRSRKPQPSAGQPRTPAPPAEAELAIAHRLKVVHLQGKIGHASAWEQLTRWRTAWAPTVIVAIHLT